MASACAILGVSDPWVQRNGGLRKPNSSRAEAKKVQTGLGEFRLCLDFIDLCGKRMPKEIDPGSLGMRMVLSKREEQQHHLGVKNNMDTHPRPILLNHVSV